MSMVVQPTFPNFTYTIKAIFYIFYFVLHTPNMSGVFIFTHFFLFPELVRELFVKKKIGRKNFSNNKTMFYPTQMIVNIFFIAT